MLRQKGPAVSRSLFVMKNRASPRRRALKAGTILVDRASTIDCVVCNGSDTGALLEVASPFGIPDDFTLVVKADKLTRPCHVAWLDRGPLQIGRPLA